MASNLTQRQNSTKPELYKSGQRNDHFQNTNSIGTIISIMNSIDGQQDFWSRDAIQKD